MGMFDRFIDASGAEWQTKALGCSLSCWSIGEEVPVGFDCQMEAIGDSGDDFPWGLATIRDGRLEWVPTLRDESLPLIPYGGLGASYATSTESEGLGYDDA